MKRKNAGAPGMCARIFPFPGFLKKEARTGSSGLSGSGLLSFLNRDLLAVLAQMLKADNTAGGGKQRVVAADAHVHTRMDVGAALANQNVAGLDELAVCALGTKALGLRVTAVLGGAAALFMGEELQTNTNHHAGHCLLMERVRARLGPESSVICVMSGNFVQRGDFALTHRLARAEAAVKSGADLVLELPLPWAVFSAERFADGGVRTLAATGVVTHLAFGSECGDAEALGRVAAGLRDPAFSPFLRRELETGVSFAAARQRAAEALLGREDAALLGTPNNILGIEYCKSLQAIRAPIRPLTVRREGAAHGAAHVAHGQQMHPLPPGTEGRVGGIPPLGVADVHRPQCPAGDPKRKLLGKYRRCPADSPRIQPGHGFRRRQLPRVRHAEGGAPIFRRHIKKKRQRGILLRQSTFRKRKVGQQ